jgi:hypothetical protein
LERPPRAEPEIVAVPTAPKPAPLKRNPQIRLFKHAPSGAEPAVADAAADNGPDAEPVVADLEGSEPILEPACAEPRLPASLFARLMTFLRSH